MQKIVSSIGAVAIAVSSFASVSAPALAAPAAPAMSTLVDGNSGIEQVKHRHKRSGFYTYNGYGYYNGHRGSRRYHRGYRSHNGYWFPAFVFGAIVGSTLATPQRGYRVVETRGNWSAHVDWCYDRYRSYRQSDNTFQPYHGSRRACVSPYYR